METRVYSWGDGRPWHSYAAYCRRHFGGRVRKIAVDAGLSCPNRDGTIGSEGVRSVITGRSPFLLFAPEEPGAADRRGNRFPCGPRAGRRALSGLFPAFFQYARSCHATSGALCRSVGSSPDFGTGDRHAARLRGRREVGFAGGAGAETLCGGRIRRRIHLRRNIAGRPSRP